MRKDQAAIAEIEVIEDWRPGHYRLEVIQGDQNLQLLARSDFEITAYGAPVTAFEFPIVVESK